MPDAAEAVQEEDQKPADTLACCFAFARFVWPGIARQILRPLATL